MTETIAPPAPLEAKSHRTTPESQIGDPVGTAWREDVLTRAKKLASIRAYLLECTSADAADPFWAAISDHLEAVRQAAEGRKGPQRSAGPRRPPLVVDHRLDPGPGLEQPRRRRGQPAPGRPRLLPGRADAQPAQPRPAPPRARRRPPPRARAHRRPLRPRPGRERQHRHGRHHRPGAQRHRQQRPRRQHGRPARAAAGAQLPQRPAGHLAGDDPAGGRRGRPRHGQPSAVPLCFQPEKSGQTVVVCPTQQSALVETEGQAGPADPDVDDVVKHTAGRADLLVVELIGLTAAAVAAATALRGIRGSSEPYGLPVALATLKLPMGAVTAFLGLLLMRGQFVPGLSALDTSAQILAWALVFGYAQQLFTRFVDQQAHSVLDTVRQKQVAA